jgi:hypothetical protein
MLLLIDSMPVRGNTQTATKRPINREAHHAETHAQQGQRVTGQDQKMERLGGQPVRQCRLHQRSIVETVAELLTFCECSECGQRGKR